MSVVCVAELHSVSVVGPVEVRHLQLVSWDRDGLFCDEGWPERLAAVPVGTLSSLCGRTADGRAKVGAPLCGLCDSWQFEVLQAAFEMSCRRVRVAPSVVGAALDGVFVDDTGLLDGFFRMSRRVGVMADGTVSSLALLLPWLCRESSARAPVSR